MTTPMNEEEDKVFVLVDMVAMSKLADINKTHLTRLNNVSIKLSDLIVSEVTALKRTIDVYERNPEAKAAGVPDMIRKRIIEFKNLVEEFNEVGELLSADFGDVFLMIAESEEYEEEEGDENA